MAMSSFDEKSRNLICLFYEGGCFKSNSRQNDGDDYMCIIGSENQYRISVSIKRRWRKIQASTFVIELIEAFFLHLVKVNIHRFLQANVMLFPTYSTPNSILISHHCQGHTNLWVVLYYSFSLIFTLSNFKRSIIPIYVNLKFVREREWKEILN